MQETKKLRTQRRIAREKEKQELVKQGLLEPPKPKVKISNLMRVLGAEATAGGCGLGWARQGWAWPVGDGFVWVGHLQWCAPSAAASPPPPPLPTSSDAPTTPAPSPPFALPPRPADPTAIEQEVRQQMAERAAAHEDRNLARMLTPAERQDKKLRKLVGEEQPETHVALYKVRVGGGLGGLLGLCVWVAGGSARLAGLVVAPSARLS